MMKVKRSSKKESARVYWNDAVIYKKNHGESFPKPTKMLTYGKLVKDMKNYLIIGNPLTEEYDEELKEFIPKPYVTGRELKEATFFYIPKGMVTKVMRS